MRYLKRGVSSTHSGVSIALVWFGLVCLFYWANLPRGKEHEQYSGPMRGAPPYPTQTRKTREIDHNTGNYVPYRALQGITGSLSSTYFTVTEVTVSLTSLLTRSFEYLSVYA